LFVAIDLPEATKNLLNGLRGDIAGAVWAKRHTFHLTLRFLGDQIPTTRIEPIITALRGAHFAPFEMRVWGVGRFPQNLRQPARVLWAGIEAPTALETLNMDVERALETIEFPPEDRDFHPHITLARLKSPKNDPAVDAFLAEHRQLTGDTVRVTAFYLVESVLTPQGPQYTKRANFEATHD
jgi:2'-5' RNA ligase